MSNQIRWFEEEVQNNLDGLNKEKKRKKKKRKGEEVVRERKRS